jgi:hypothetical protein
MLRWVGPEDRIVAVGGQSSRKPLEGSISSGGIGGPFIRFGTLAEFLGKLTAGGVENCVSADLYSMCYQLLFLFPCLLYFLQFVLLSLRFKAILVMGDRQDKDEVLWRAGAISSPKITACSRSVHPPNPFTAIAY